jgi:hypothetical protein
MVIRTALALAVGSAMAAMAIRRVAFVIFVVAGRRIIPEHVRP